MGTSGVKVTYIETQFVTSDAVSFKSLVQSLTGKNAIVGAAPARPQPRRGSVGTVNSIATGTVPQSFYMSSAGSASIATGDMRASRNAPPCLEEPQELCDFSELFHVGASERNQGGGYNDFLY